MIGIVDVTSVESMEEHILNKNNPHGVTLGQLGGGLEKDTTVFVSKSGNDTTGDGTSAKPFLTIGKAISFLPKNLNGRRCIVNIAAGTYSEVVAFHDFTGGAVVINGVTNAIININGLTVENCNLLINDIALTVSTQGVFVGPKGLLYSGSAKISVSGAATAFTLRYGATLEITTPVVINNASNVAILAQYGSTASFTRVSGTNINIAVYIYQSVVYINELLATANVLAVNENGAFYQKGAVG